MLDLTRESLTSGTATVTPPQTWVDVLPTRGGSRIALSWLPHSEDFKDGEGFAILTGARDRTGYAVSEAPDSAGRSFLFTKVGGKGTAANRSAYVVLCDHDGTHGRCECDGHRRWGWCKHSDAVQTLIMNRWL